MARYIIAHDVGTSGNKAVLVDTEGRVRGKCFEPYKTYYPSPGWVEQGPQDWWRAVRVPPTKGFNWDSIRNPRRSVHLVTEYINAALSKARYQTLKTR